MDSGRIHEKKSVRHACKACCEFASISSPTTKFGGGNYRVEMGMNTCKL
jgi:hypothetical protein